MSKSISLSAVQWGNLYIRLKQDFPITTLLIRSRMRDTLGFVPRDHYDYDLKKTTIELDFYDEGKRVMFLLRYGDIVSRTTDRVL